MSAIRKHEEEAEQHRVESARWAELLQREELQRRDLEASITKMEEKEKCLQIRLRDVERKSDDKSKSELKTALDQQHHMSQKLKELEELCSRLKEETKDSVEHMERRAEENVLRSKVRDLSQEQWEEQQRQHQLRQADQERKCKRLEEQRNKQRNLEERLKESEAGEERMERDRMSSQLREVREQMEKERDRQRTLEEESQDLKRKLEETQQHISTLKEELGQEVQRREGAEQEVKQLKLKLESQESELQQMKWVKKGLHSGLEELSELKELLQESHDEEARLKSALSQRSEELQRPMSQRHPEEWGQDQRDRGQEEQDREQELWKSEQEGLRAQLHILMIQRTDLLEQMEELRESRDQEVVLQRARLEQMESELETLRGLQEGSQGQLETGSAERLLTLQRVVAELELEQKRLVQKIGRLQKDNQRLREERSALREALGQVELRWSRTHISGQTPQSQQGLPTEEERLRGQVRSLEEQKAHFIEALSRNNQQLQSLHGDLSTSLTVVSRRTTPTVLHLETQRLDQSLRDEERLMSLSQL
ncbi:hypothetical protein NQD34_015855 [Periophthalmus magnuspinnatus]|nr:hypothetical protein NQD34_015855 [Periophthalmus magnuspinnatus]